MQASSSADSLPDAMRHVVKAVTGLDLGDVRVHRDSPKPALIGAAAYAERNEIFIAPGGEHTLGHEVWHIVQQRLGRVASTRTLGGMALNEDAALEREADELGARLASGDIGQHPTVAAPTVPAAPMAAPPVIQAKFGEHGGLWIDDETAERYEVVAWGDEYLVARRTRDNFEVVVDRKTFLPIDPSPTHRRARLDTKESWTTHLSHQVEAPDETGDIGDELLDEDELRFEKREDAEQAQHLTYLEGRGERQRTRKLRNKRPSPFNAPVVLAPIPRGEAASSSDAPSTSEAPSTSAKSDESGRTELGDGKFTAAELLISELHASNERPPTRFEPLQKSHTVAWVLVRASIIAFSGRRLTDLLAFLVSGFDELLPQLEASAATGAENSSSAQDDASSADAAPDLEEEEEDEQPDHQGPDEEEEEEGEDDKTDDSLNEEDEEVAARADADDDQAEYDEIWKARQDPSRIAAQVVVDRELLGRLTGGGEDDGERLPLETWTHVVSELVRGYETARHKTLSASLSKGAAKGRGEAAAMRRLRTLEKRLASGQKADVAGFYKKVPKPKKKAKPTLDSDFIQLLDVAFNASLPPEEYKRAVKYWYRLIHIAFPHLAPQFADKILESFVSKRKLPKSLGGDGKQDLSEFLPETELWTDELEPVEQQKKPHDIGGMDRTGLAGFVRLNPPVHDTPRKDVPRDEEFTLDQLEVGYVIVGEKRPKTRWGEKQFSHTVAWTLIRASVESFSRQPFANLFAFLLHTAEDLVENLDEEIKPKRGAVQDDDGSSGTQHPKQDAQRCIADLQRLSGLRASLSTWHSVASHGLIEVLRLYNLSRAAVYSKEAKGNNEGFAMQVLRENEASLGECGALLDEPDYVAKKAHALLDVEQAANLSWRDYARAVVHWEEHLSLAFPRLLSVGRDKIVKPILDRKLDGAAVWNNLPGSVTTVQAMVDQLRTEQRGRDTRRFLPKIEPAGLLGSNTTFREQPTIPGEDSGLHAFAQMLVGAVVQKQLDAAAVATTLGAPRELLAAALGAGGAHDAASRRAVQRALAPYLRRAAAAMVVDAPIAVVEIIAQCRAEVLRLINANSMSDVASSAAPATGAPFRDPGSPLAQALQAIAVTIAGEVASDAADRPAQLEHRASAWSVAHGVNLYARAIAQPGIAIGDRELFVLARRFGIQFVTFRDVDGAVVADVCAPIEDDSGAKHPVAGVRAAKDGRYAAVTTDHGAYDLRSAEKHDAEPTDRRPRAVPEQLSQEVHGTARAPTEGTVRVAGKRHVVWQTTGDNNCAFNGMALCLTGLVQQKRLDGAKLAQLLEIDVAALEHLTTDAARAQTDRAAARRIELALSARLRHAAIEKLRQRVDLHHAMLDEFVDEVRGRLCTLHGVPWVRVSDLFVNVADIRNDLETVTGGEALAKSLADKTVAEKASAIDEIIVLHRTEIEKRFLEHGIHQYLASMKPDRVWGGGPELHALAGALGIHVTIFRDAGGGIVNRDEGIANAGSVDVALLGDDSTREKRVETLRSLDLIEGRVLAVQSPRIYFRRISREDVAARLQPHPELGEVFLALYDQYYLYRAAAPVEIGMFRHHARAHWSALSTERGGFDLQDNGDHLDGRQVPDRPVDGPSRSPVPSFGISRARQHADTKRPAEGTFKARGASYVAWRTTGDDNCAFNGFAQVLMGLVAQKKLDPKVLAAKTGVAPEILDALVAKATNQQRSGSDARAVEKALSMPLRKLATAALKANNSFHAAMAEELVDELRGLVYAKYGCPWVRASDLFVDARSSVKRALIPWTETADEALVADCSGKNIAQVIVLVDAWIETIRGELTTWFNETGIGLYCDDMQQDRVWGGGPELHAAAAELGIHLTIFKDLGGGLVASDEGAGAAGSAPAEGLDEAAIIQLRAAGLIEGRKDVSRIYFLRVGGEEVAKRTAKLPPLLRDWFLAQRNEHYAYRDIVPTEVGMFRHAERAHWSAASTAQGAYALTDSTDHLKGDDVPKAPVDSAPDGDYDLAYAIELSAAQSAGPKSPAKGTSPDGGTATANIRFEQRKLKNPHVGAVYSDHKFGYGAPFEVGKVDPTRKSGERMALVNAANESLRGGGGIDGAIMSLEGKDKHGAPSRHAEIDAWEAKKGQKGIAPGSAMTTTGGDLQKSGVDAVIHTVGPRLSEKKPAQVLESCVDAVMAEAAAHAIAIVVFCNLSSGKFLLDAGFTANVIQNRIDSLLAAPPASWKGWLPRKIVFNKFPKHDFVPKRPQSSDAAETGAKPKAPSSPTQPSAAKKLRRATTMIAAASKPAASLKRARSDYAPNEKSDESEESEESGNDEIEPNEFYDGR